MAKSEQFLKRTLTDIAVYKLANQAGEHRGEIRAAAPSDIFSAAERMTREFGVILTRDKNKPGASRYIDPVLLANWPDTAISVREGTDLQGVKTFTFVALRFQDGTIASEHDLATYTPIEGVDAKGERFDPQLNAAAAQLLKELDIFLDSERTHEEIVHRAATEAGVA